MGADAAVERHDGTPPGEDELAARMRAEGLSQYGWGNGRNTSPACWPQALDASPAG